MTTKGVKRDASLLRTLAERFRGSVTPGAEWRGEIVEGDLVAEVTVRIRRHVSPDAARGYREGALAALTKDTFRVRHCECPIQRRGWIGKYSGQCSGRVTTAVVCRAAFGGGELAYQFVCNRHRDAPGIRPEAILATVALPESALRPIHAQDEVNQRAWSEKCRAEDAEREAADPLGHRPMRQRSEP